MTLATDLMKKVHEKMLCNAFCHTDELYISRSEELNIFASKFHHRLENGQEKIGKIQLPRY
jgi:hypothetical protein